MLFFCKRSINRQILYGFRWLILIYFLFSSVSLHSQTVKWSQPLQDNKKIPYLLILGENDKGNVYILRSNRSFDTDRDRYGSRNRTYILQYYSSDLVLLWEKELLTSYKEGHISDVGLINGKVVVTSYMVDKKNKIYYFYAQYIDDDGNWTGKAEALENFSSDLLDEDKKPGMIISRDHSLVAFSYRKISADRKSQSFLIVVMDTNLVLNYKKEIPVPASIQLFEPLDFVLTNRGSFFILGIHYSTEKKNKGPDQSFYELYGYNQFLDRIFSNVIRRENKYFTDAAMTADNYNHSIVVAGFYSDKATYSSAGIFYYSLTEDSLKENNTINTPFGSLFLQKFLGGKRESKELVNFSIDRLIVRKDGGVALIAESKYETDRSYFDNYMQTFISHTYYHYGNIMVLSVNPDGNFLWNNVINKDQNSVDDGGIFSSYYCAVTDGRLVGVYNKYIEEESSVLITFIDGGGVQKTDVLFNEVQKINVIPQSGKQINEETVLMPAYKQNKYYIIQINF